MYWKKHRLQRVWHYPCFQVSTEDLLTYSLLISGDYCIVISKSAIPKVCWGSTGSKLFYTKTLFAFFTLMKVQWGFPEFTCPVQQIE